MAVHVCSQKVNIVCAMMILKIKKQSFSGRLGELWFIFYLKNSCSHAVFILQGRTKIEFDELRLEVENLISLIR
ncbi:hypothetical protein BpHYR1_028503 [Brachionus plicatilis]|uniref:Uncharacterized protein n=1 Tax=Brachionus plicatilis TaxID=10195 RepID=A0A3M7QHD0_BRAPC|nr:hypothetical protein BpHYR1_028503 [Brachionus plicatilis]